jgi:inosose dehydratase
LNHSFTRRTFAKGLALGAAALISMPKSLLAAKQRNIHIGHTGITWLPTDVEHAISDVAKLGFYGFETFGDVLEKREAQGGIADILHKNHLPFISGYCTLNLTDVDKRKDEIAKAISWSRLIKKYNGRIFVLGPNQVKRETYNYAANKTNIINTLNEAAKAITDEGLTPVLHQHTSTCVETRDETYATLDAVDTRYLKFGPDVGQLTKGGADPVKVVKDYLPLVQHMHLKDYNGKDDHLIGYCPLGQGKVNVAAILDMMEGRKISGMVMGELDNDWGNMSPTPSYQLAEQSKKYLKSLGVKFRA